MKAKYVDSNDCYDVNYNDDDGDYGGADYYDGDVTDAKSMLTLSAITADGLQIYVNDKIGQ